MFATRKISLLFMGLCVMALAQNSMAQSVNCDRVRDDQRQLQQAFDQAQPDSVVSISGTCREVSLVIKVDGLTVQGPAVLMGSGAGPVLRVQDVGGVNLVDLEVSGGVSGVEVTSARVSALNVTASGNAAEGFSVIQGGNLVCTNCEAKTNGQSGLLVVGGVTLCGTGVFAENTDGILVFLGGRIFSNASVCGGVSDLVLVDNTRAGLSLFQGGVVFMDEVELDTSSNDGVGMAIQLGSNLTVRNSTIVVDDNGSSGLFINEGAVVRFNDTGVGTTSIQNNFFFGAQIVANSAIFLGGASGDVDNNDVAGFALSDVFVEDFSIANDNGSLTFGVISCEAGQSSGSLCPP